MRAALASAALLGCMPPASAPHGANAAPKAAPAPGPRAGQLEAANAERPVPVLPIPSCSDVGPRACAGPPSPAGSFCPAVADCARRFPIHAQGALPFVDCEQLTDETPASAGSGLEATAVVALRGREGEVAVHGWQATALLARYPNGVCVVDSLFDWAFLHGGWFETELTYTWSPGEDGASQLDIAGRLSSRLSLDQSELEAGVSNLSYVLCKRATYSVKDGRFRRLHEEHDLCSSELDSR